jgi:hypothetical protein
VNGSGYGPEALRKYFLAYQRKLPLVATDMKEKVASGLLLEAHFSENR